VGISRITFNDSKNSYNVGSKRIVFKNAGGSVGEKLAKAYQKRVIADGGTYENEPCLVAALNRLNSI
jgi:hypothetical protein